MKRLLFALPLLPLITASTVAQTAADSAWAAVQAIGSSPQKNAASREEARAVALDFISKKETALRQFLNQHAADPRAIEASISLAHLWTTKSDFTGQPAFYEAAVAMLDKAIAAAPEQHKPDFAYAKVTIAMRRVTQPTESDREALTAQALAFQSRYPTDRRVAGLLTEIATLHDQQPKRKQSLLEAALKVAPSDEVRARIHDDLKRLALLGQPLSFSGKSTAGETIDLAALQGKVVVLYFFGGFSAPSIAGLDEANYLRNTFSPNDLEIIGVSLDPSLEVLQNITAPKGILWPIVWDGKGWGSPLVRSYGINALPTLWIIDKKGRLRTLNARTESESFIRSLLKES